ncbi:MAG: hypothetical protein V4612_04760 [Pseudomonadota bacterium]
MDQNHQLIDAIKKRLKLRKILVFLCAIILICGLLSFLFYGFDATNSAIKFISKKDQIDNVEKVMLNPYIKFEHDDNQFYDIKAKKAVHKNKDDVELFDVKASGNKGDISAGNLLITNSGNDLHFSNNPILIIRETKNE